MSDLSKQFISSVPITHMSRLQWVQFKGAIEQLHELEAENEHLKALNQGRNHALIISLEKEVSALRAKVSMLKAPVTHEEWQDYGQPFSGMFDKLDRAGVNRIIAVRAKEPTPTS